MGVEIIGSYLHIWKAIHLFSTETGEQTLSFYIVGPILIQWLCLNTLTKASLVQKLYGKTEKHILSIYINI